MREDESFGATQTENCENPAKSAKIRKKRNCLQSGSETTVKRRTSSRCAKRSTEQKVSCKKDLKTVSVTATCESLDESEPVIAEQEIVRESEKVKSYLEETDQVSSTTQPGKSNLKLINSKLVPHSQYSLRQNPKFLQNFRPKNNTLRYIF
jgi:ribosome assembly protein YihI (activator of Der GTPase)